jgi:methyl-accepting chemotaxis protein
MNLKTKLLLASSAIVLVVLGLSEWIGYRQMSHFLSGHEMQMASEMNHGAVLSDLQEGRQALLLRLATLHTFHAIITIAALIAALNILWSRTVLRPLADLIRHINYMGRGNWTTPVPVQSKDEIGELTEAFNELGGKLTLTVHQFASASKLSALSLLGQSLVKKAVLASDLLRASRARTECDQEQGEAASEVERARVQLPIKTLEEIPVLFDVEFQRELSLHSVPPDPRPTDLLEGNAVSQPGTHVPRSCPAGP